MLLDCQDAVRLSDIYNTFFLSIDGSLFLVLLVLFINISKILFSCASVWKAGAKIKTFSLYFQIFRKFFQNFFFRSDLTHGLSCEREKSDSGKPKSLSVQFLNLCGSLLSESGGKITPFFSTSKIFNDFFSYIFHAKTITG